MELREVVVNMDSVFSKIDCTFRTDYPTANYTLSPSVSFTMEVVALPIEGIMNNRRWHFRSRHGYNDKMENSNKNRDEIQCVRKCGHTCHKFHFVFILSL